MRTSAGTLALVLAALACSENAPGPEVTYRLVASEAGPLPLMLQVDSCYHVLKAGDVRIQDSKYVSTLGVEKACPGKGTQQLMLGGKGSVETRGDSLIFSDSTGTVNGRASLRSDTLTVLGASHQLTYVRQ